ncbi:hypothetical protein GCM10010923_09700 [Blastomonas marina]|uniref:Permease n=1 Tax=Blastomonas marina TaxID=1867408 RepID=A0ABQ1F9H0_9SPHN|nr:hypothetical protein [Blastomonas marina]GGA02932.1 hypothetical protein GCM10010923_09700 [Blastomonas marina]
MFIGHWAPALAAAASTKRAPKLGTLFVAAQLVDWAFFTLALFGVEKMRIDEGASALVPFDLYYMPYTHSLLGTVGFALAFGLFVLWLTKNQTGAVIAMLVVVSHWFVDWLVHVPDLTLAGGETKLGLGLWNEPVIAIVLELAITALAFSWYIRSTKGPIVPPIVLGVVLVLLQAINWFAPPPEAAGPSLYIGAMIAFAIVTLAAWWVGSTRWHRSQVGLAVSS